MFSVFLLWVHESTEGTEKFPELEYSSTVVNNLMTLGYTSATSINHILADRRSNYTKFRRYTRNYKSYMELFKEVEGNVGKLEVSIKLLQGNIESKEECIKEYLRHLKEYRFIYGDKCIFPETPTEYYNLLSQIAPHPEPPPQAVEAELELSKEERRRISRRKYETKVRERLNQKSKLYYETHKEELKAKRITKRNAGK